MADNTETQIWRTNYKAMSYNQLVDEQKRINEGQFTDRDERLSLIASEMAMKAER